jgi:hypothetical protein
MNTHKTNGLGPLFAMLIITEVAMGLAQIVAQAKDALLPALGIAACIVAMVAAMIVYATRP